MLQKAHRYTFYISSEHKDRLDVSLTFKNVKCHKLCYNVQNSFVNGSVNMYQLPNDQIGFLIKVWTESKPTFCQNLVCHLSESYFVQDCIRNAKGTQILVLQGLGENNFLVKLDWEFWKQKQSRNASILPIPTRIGVLQGAWVRQGAKTQENRETTERDRGIGSRVYKSNFFSIINSKKP